MPPFEIVETLDVSEDGKPRLIPGFEPAAADELRLLSGHEALLSRVARGSPLLPTRGMIPDSRNVFPKDEDP
jgi:hypothetical protein